MRVYGRGDMGLVVRLASLDDVRAVTEVHCSDVKKWRKRIGNEWVKASYEELSVGERFEHGGPWMSVETCAVHLNYVLVSGQYPLVAELEGKVVGELELYVGEEPGVLGKTGFIDVLVVHRDYRRRGVGRALVEKAREIAKAQGCDTLSVWPEEIAVPFYEKCGLRDVAYRVAYVVLDTERQPQHHHEYRVSEFPRSYEEIRDLALVSPRFFSSIAAWLKSRWAFALEGYRETVLEGALREVDAVFALETMWKGEDECRVLLWLRDTERLGEVLAWLCSEAWRRRVKRLHLALEQSLLPLLESFGLVFRKEKEYVVLYEKL